MKRSITFVMAAFATIALSACGSGQHAQTADQVAPVPGTAASYTDAEKGTVSIRNAHVPYPGAAGFAAGAAAPLKIWLFNDTAQPVNVVIASEAGTVRPEQPIVIPPSGLSAPDITIGDLRQALGVAGSITITVEFVGLRQFTISVPVAPPTQPAPRAELVLPSGTPSEGH